MAQLCTLIVLHGTTVYCVLWWCYVTLSCCKWYWFYRHCVQSGGASCKPCHCVLRAKEIIIIIIIIIIILTYFMMHSPSWEAHWFAAIQEIPPISRNPKVHYRTHKRPPPVSILGQPNPVHIPTSHLLEIHPNIIHLSTPRSPQWSPSRRFPHQDPIHPLSSPIRAKCPTHLILLDFITRTILGEEYKSLSSSLCNLLHSLVTSSLLGPNILLNTMFSNTLSLKLSTSNRQKWYTNLKTSRRRNCTERMQPHGTTKHVD